MTCDRDDLDFPSPCSRTAPPQEAALARCETALLDLLVARPTPTDAEIVATVHRARRLLAEAVQAAR